MEEALTRAFGENAPIMWALVGAYCLALVSGMKDSVEYKRSPSARDWIDLMSVLGKIGGSMFILGAGAAVFWGPESILWTLLGAILIMLFLGVPALLKYRSDKKNGLLDT